MKLRIRVEKAGQRPTAANWPFLSVARDLATAMTELGSKQIASGFMRVFVKALKARLRR